jgi:hypothetical protein
VSNKISATAVRPALARQLVRSALDGVPVEVVETASLLASELVTNALVHGSGTATVVLEVCTDRVRVEVQDSDPTIDLSPIRVEPRSLHGRGLALVDALASAWGVESRGAGKAVWFQLEL